MARDFGDIGKQEVEVLQLPVEVYPNLDSTPEFIVDFYDSNPDVTLQQLSDWTWRDIDNIKDILMP